MNFTEKKIDCTVLIFITIIWAVVVVYKATEVPSLWFDEGWTLSVARNWVESGKYARLLNGEFISASPMAHPISVTGPVAISFRLLGVGVWQGRLPGAIFTLGAFIIFYFLIKHLYGRSIALGTMFVLLFMSTLPQHPFHIGRQTVAEYPMIFFLVIGYYGYLLSLRRPRWSILIAVIFWGIALATKKQPLPFFIASLIVPALFALTRKEFRFVRITLVALFGALVVWQMLGWIEQSLTKGLPLYGSPLRGLYLSSGWVLRPTNRLLITNSVLWIGIPLIIGLIYTGLQYRSKDFVLQGSSEKSMVKISLYILTTSWFAWFLFLSIGWSRYLAPILFFGSAFVALALHDFTFQFDIRRTLLIIGSSMHKLRFGKDLVKGLTAVLMILYTTMVGLLFLVYSYRIASHDVYMMTDYINQYTPGDALIETYDSEIMFLIDRAYHFPPDQIHVDLNFRAFLKQDVDINYNPLESDPDYFVIGPRSRLWELYQPILETGMFQLVYEVGEYELYEPIHVPVAKIIRTR